MLLSTTPASLSVVTNYTYTTRRVKTLKLQLLPEYVVLVVNVCQSYKLDMFSLYDAVFLYVQLINRKILIF